MEEEVKQEPVDFNDDPEQRERFTRPPTPYQFQLNEEVEGEGGGGEEVAVGVYVELPYTSTSEGGDVVSVAAGGGGEEAAVAWYVELPYISTSEGGDVVSVAGGGGGDVFGGACSSTGGDVVSVAYSSAGGGGDVVRVASYSAGGGSDVVSGAYSCAGGGGDFVSGTYFSTGGGGGGDVVSVASSLAGGGGDVVSVAAGGGGDVFGGACTSTGGDVVSVAYSSAGGGGDVVSVASSSAGGGSDVVTVASSSSGSSNAIAQVVNNRKDSFAGTTEETQNNTGPFKKSTCLFCGGMLFVHVNTDQQSVEQVEQVTGLVKNLCHQMQLNDEGFPERCNDNMFPFCVGCKQLLQKSLDLKEEYVRKMAESIKQIRDTVIRSETNKRPTKPALQATEALKFTKFRDMILDAQSNDYISNLELPTANSSSNNNIVIQPNSCNKHVQTDPLQLNVDIYDPGNRAGPSTSCRPDSYLVAGISEARPGPSRAPPPTPPPDDEIAGPSSAAFGLPPGSKGKAKKVQKNMKTKKLTSISLPAAFQPVVVLDRQLTLQVKQEINARLEEHYELNYDADDDECWEVKKKRKFSYRGVAIYSCFDKNGVEFVQCSSCKFHRPIEKIPKGEYIARKEVRLHIANIHAPPPPKPKTPHPCNICHAILDSKVALRHHRRNHATERPGVVPCDICGRPFLEKKQVYLLRHQFFHKNAEEKQAEIEAREMNAAERRLHDAGRPKDKKKRKKRVGTKPKAKPRMPSELPVGCSICQRRFPRSKDVQEHRRLYRELRKLCSEDVDVSVNVAAPTPDPDTAEVTAGKRSRRKPSNFGDPPTPTPQKKRKASTTGAHPKGKKPKDGNPKDSRGMPEAVAGHSRKAV